jgi:hypothetical protein
MSNDYSLTIKHVENAMQLPRIQCSTNLLDVLYKQAWFAGLYIASLVCLTAIGTVIRLALSAIY